MTDLLARLQAATQGSAELDAAVLRAAGWRPSPGTSTMWIAPDDTWAKHVGEPTRSLDAIDALIEARGWEWRYRGTKYVRHTAEVALNRTRGGWVGEADSTASLALCIAFVRALAAQEGGA